MIKNSIYKLVLSAFFLALCLVLPFLTGQIPEIGNMLCPMHIPVLLCAYFCGPLCAGAVGLVAPVLRSLIFGMPPLFPVASAMSFELLTYGLVAGLLYILFKKKAWGVYASLLISMVAGRLVWGAVTALFYKIQSQSFTPEIFWSSAVVNAIPGIILQIVAIPIIVITLKAGIDAASRRGYNQI